MKKFVLALIIFISGILIGFCSYYLMTNSYGLGSNQIKSITDIADLEILSNRIFATGDYKSSIIMLNHLINKIELIEKSLNDSEYRNLRIDKGLAHYRLHTLYKKEGNEDQANKEYSNAVRLLSKEHGNLKEDDFKNLFEELNKLSLKKP